MDKKTPIPTHIAIIMDGNRRWARQRGLPALAGHEKVANEILEPLIEYAAKRGICYMTFWAFSTENWQRDRGEVAGIMRLFRHVIMKRWQRLHEKGVAVKVIGDILRFPKDIQQALADVVKQTKNNTTITAIFALNYGGRDEIVRAVYKLLKSPKSLSQSGSDLGGVKGLTLSSQSLTPLLTEQQFSRYLDTAGIPDPDIIVRPGGEKRLSGFMLWQCQYSELFFADWYMPEFSNDKLDEILADYALRQRRFGK